MMLVGVKLVTWVNHLEKWLLFSIHTKHIHVSTGIILGRIWQMYIYMIRIHTHIYIYIYIFTVFTCQCIKYLTHSTSILEANGQTTSEQCMKPTSLPRSMWQPAPPGRFHPTWPVALWPRVSYKIRTRLMVQESNAPAPYYATLN